MLNDALSIYFADATPPSAFVARWCVRAKVETPGGVFQVREDDRSHGSEPGCIGRPEREEFGRAHRERVWDSKCSKVMDRAAYYQDKAEHARQLAHLAWQPDLKDTLRSLGNV